MKETVDIDASKISEEIDRNLTEEYEKNNKIIKCLNNFEAIVEKDLEFIVPLSIKKTDVYIAFEQVKLKMQYINETLIQENSLEELALIIFKLLFLSDNNLNYENLDEKVETFETILKILEGKPDIQKENLLIDSISAEKQEWKDLIDLLSLEFGGFSFIFCVFLKYKNSLEQVVEFFFRFLRVSFDCFVNCDKNMKISEESAAKDLYVLLNEILQDKNAKYELKIVEGKIVKKLISVEELTKLLTLKDDSSFGKIKRLNNVNENKADENKGINKDKDVNLKPNDNNNISEEHEINENGNKISEVQVIKEDTNKISETQVINEVGNKISEAQVIKENVNEMSEVQGKDLINNKFNILEMRIKSLEDEKDENTKIIKNLEVEKKALKLENAKNVKKFESQLKKTKKHMYDLQKKLSSVENDLKLIKSRAAFKAFIDLFYRGLGLSDPLKWDKKVDKILTSLNKFGNPKLYDLLKVNEVRSLLLQCSNKLTIGNTTAHSMDLAKEVLEQIFELIDPEKKCLNILESLKKTNADIIIKKVIIIKEQYYNNKEKRIEEEKAAYDKLDKSAISSLFAIKQNK